MKRFAANRGEISRRVVVPHPWVGGGSQEIWTRSRLESQSSGPNDEGGGGRMVRRSKIVSGMVALTLAALLALSLIHI